MKKTKEPILRISKRTELSRNKIWLLRLFSILLAIVAGGIFILAIGHNPIKVYSTIVSGVFKNKISLQLTIRTMVPLLITALGLTMAFKMQFWNIGGEGQIIMGAVFASYFALHHNTLPHWVLIIIMLIAGIIGGGLWG